MAGVSIMPGKSTTQQNEQHTLKYQQPLKKRFDNYKLIFKTLQKNIKKALKKQHINTHKAIKDKKPLAPTPATKQKNNNSISGTHAIIAAYLGCSVDRAKVLYSQLNQITGNTDLSKVQNTLANNEGGESFIVSGGKHLALESISTAMLDPVGGLVTSMVAVGTESAEEDANEKIEEKNEQDRAQSVSPNENYRNEIIPPFARTSPRN